MINLVIFLSVVASIGVISASICSPAMPIMGEYFGAGQSDLQLIISLFLAGNALGQLLSGLLSDYIGQRAVLFWGLLLFIASSSLAAVSDSLFGLHIARFFQGMGTAAGPVLARAIAAKNFPEKTSAKILSYGSLCIGIVSILAMMGSGYITLISWRGCFWITSALGLFLFIWAFFALKGECIAPKEAPTLRSMVRTFYQPQFLVMAVAHSVTYGLMYGYIGLFPFILKGFFPEISPQDLSLNSVYMILVYMLGTTLAAKYVSRLTPTYLVFLGVIMQVFAGFLLCLSMTSTMFFLAIGLFNLSLGIVLPMTSAAALAPAVSKGIASSTLGLSYRLSGSLISYLISLMPLNAGFNLGLVIFSLSLLSFFILYIPKRQALA